MKLSMTYRRAFTSGAVGGHPGHRKCPGACEPRTPYSSTAPVATTYVGRARRASRKSPPRVNESDIIKKRGRLPLCEDADRRGALRAGGGSALARAPRGHADRPRVTVAIGLVER